MLMRKITLFLIAVAALAFAAHAGQLSASPGTTTSVEPAIANSLSDLDISTQDANQTSWPVYYGFSEDGVVGYNVEINGTESNCTIYYRHCYAFGEWTEWMEYSETLTFTDLGHHRIEAYAIAPGKSPSQVIAYEFVVMDITLNPTISVTHFEDKPGCFVEIIEGEPNSTIYYSIQYPNGDFSDLMVYGGGLTFTEPGNYLIEAYAIAPGKIQSETVSYEFAVQEQTSWPVYYGFSEDGVVGYNVEISATEPNCTIYYRHCYAYGEWTQWTEYSGILTFTDLGHHRIEAYAVAPGKSSSQTIAYEFVVMEKTVSPTVNCYPIDGQQGYYVDIIENEPECTIYYIIQTTDGGWDYWEVYSGTIVLTEPGEYYINAYAVAPGKSDSEVVTCEVVVTELEQTEAPTFYGYTIDGVEGFNLEINEIEPDCTLYYRVRYPDPDGEWTDWMEYTETLTFTEVGRYRVEAYAVADGKTPSQTIAFEFMVMPIVQPGDLNHDGILGIEDVTTLIDIIISNSTTTPECDVNQDGSVDIADVTDLIDYILAQ